MLSKKAKNLKPSPTLALNAKAKTLKAQGKDIISLSVGEPDWNSYDAVNETGIAAIREGKTKYGPAQGIPELQNEIVKDLSQYLGIPFTSDQVSITTGAKFSLFSALQCSLDPGDEVIIPTPYWVSYPVMVELTGAKSVIVTCKDFKITPELLEKSITPKTKLLTFKFAEQSHRINLFFRRIKSARASFKKTSSCVHCFR
jgi:aspartate aminotransferase